ncbi:MAG: type II toxin-antitoxin system MqsR family toxin [Gemmatimonadaceae bacterium]
MASGDGPTYELALVVALISTPRYRITGRAFNEAGELGFDECDIVECVDALKAEHFYKTMEAEKRPGFWQDVYRTEHGGIPLYVKVQLEGENPDELLVVIQFKRL